MEMTVTRGLSELKLLHARISKTITEGEYIALTTGKRTVTGYANNEEFADKAKSQLQSVKDLIRRRNAIKSAIVHSNAVTEVEVAGVKMTVAEAIEQKTAIDHKKLLLATLKNQYSNVTSHFEAEARNVTDRLDRHLQSIFGRDVKIDKGVQEDESRVFLERNEPKIINPLGLKDEIARLEDEIMQFESEVDHVLSESNSLTRITIPE